MYFLSLSIIITHNRFEYGCFDPRLTETLINLIPKVDNPIRLGECRPISLCNIVYKLIIKVLVNRLRPFLGDMIDPLQSSFILGRGSAYNVIII